MAVHTLKGLENYEEPESTSKALEDGSPPKEDPPEPPTIQVPGNPPAKHPMFGNRKMPIYVKHAYPNLFKQGNEYEQFLPKIPGAEDNYGMMYHKPESEAEMAMHELWLARRQQEAFNWKSQQHMNLVMDRYALHKSRLESDSLRRQESNSYIRSRPGSSQDETRPFSADEVVSSNARFTGTSRPSSRQKTLPKSMSARSLGYGYADSPITSPTKMMVMEPEDDLEEQQNEETEINMVMKGAGTEEDVAVPVPAREAVLKKEKKKVKKNTLAPMRYRFEPKKYEVGSVYLQLSDSDDDDKPEKVMKPPTAGKGGGGGKKGAKAAAGPAVKFKRDAPPMRERPVSANQFHTISNNDAELKVHYRYTNYRRMPLTQKQEVWLEGKETTRVKKSEEMASNLLEAAAAKGDKKGGKDKKDDKGKGKGKGKGKVEEPEKIPCKYKSASEFMSVNFPDFEDDAEGEAQGPMRMMQLLECARVMGSLNEFGMQGAVKPETLRKALIIPQDKPEAVSRENMRQSEIEGLMMNPAPEMYWRKVTYKTAGGKKGKKGKKK